jgi:hypothetical protein
VFLFDYVDDQGSAKRKTQQLDKMIFEFDPSAAGVITSMLS